MLEGILIPDKTHERDHEQTLLPSRKQMHATHSPKCRRNYIHDEHRNPMQSPTYCPVANVPKTHRNGTEKKERDLMIK